MAIVALLCLLQDIRVDYTETVSLVSVPLQVKRDGHRVSNLRREDVTVLENGVKVEVADLGLIDAGSTIHLLIDVSASQDRRLEYSVALARDLIDGLEPDDQIKISQFSTYYRSLTDYVRDRAALVRALDGMSTLGTTALYDGIEDAVTELARVDGPRALVVISDGQDLASRTTELELAAAVKNYSLPIFILAHSRPDESTPLLLQQREFLERLTASVEGAVLNTGPSALREILGWRRDHAKRYQLRYVPLDPDDTGQWRRLTVRVPSCPACQLEYRQAFKIESSL